MRPRGESRLEVVLRIRDDKSRVASEYTVRGQRVGIVNFWPDGAIADHGEMTLEQFNNEIQQIQTRRLAEVATS